MPYCPKCGYEYQPQARECPECHEALTPHPPADKQPPEPVQEPLVPVYDAPDELMAFMVRGVLEEAGIRTVTQSGVIPWYDDLRFSATGFHTRLLVFESQAAEARRIVSEYLTTVRTGEAEREVMEQYEAAEEEAQGEDA